MSPASNRQPGRLPEPSDLRWRSAPRMSTGRQIRYLPFKPPFVPATGDRLDWLRRTTRLVLLADGYPARLKQGRILVHPLDGRYLLEALLAEQAEHPRRRLRPAIARTARSVVRRAEPLGDALVMRYRDTASSMLDGRPHVSGLPQAYYAAALTRSAQLLGDASLQAAADRFFAALLVPVEDGGATYRTKRNRALALVPTRPRDLVLNGWLSMLVAVHDYAELRDSPAARELLTANLSTLRRLLSLYDVPDLRLSRYALVGPLVMRLSWTAVGPVALENLRIAVPDEGEIPMPVRDGGRWVSRVFPDEAELAHDHSRGERLVPHKNRLRLSAVLSRAPFPRTNRIRLRMAVPRPLELTLDAHIGRYDPMTSATVDRGWVRLTTRRLRSGTHDLDLVVPYAPVDLFAYPTNFTRGGPDEKVNSYHGTHIVRLRQLSDISGDPFFAEWADRWSAYVREWDSLPDLAGATCRTPEGEIS